jgi:hypothetical protein
MILTSAGKSAAAAIDPAPAGARSIERVIADMRITADIDDDVAEQMRTRAPVTSTERALVEAEKARLFSDPTWIARYLSGNRAARSQAALIHIILDLPVEQQG